MITVISEKKHDFRNQGHLMPGDILFLIKLKVKMKNSSRKILSVDSRSTVGRQVTDSRKWES